MENDKQLKCSMMIQIIEYHAFTDEIVLYRNLKNKKWVKCENNHNFDFANNDYKLKKD